MKTTILTLCLSFAFAGCGADLPSATAEEDHVVQETALCSVYLFDLPGFGVPLNPFPVSSASGTCVDLPVTSTSDRTSSYRLSGCKVQFFDGAKCTGASFSSSSSGNMPAGFDNRASSLIQW